MITSLAAWPPGRLAAWPSGRLADWPTGCLAEARYRAVSSARPRLIVRAGKTIRTGKTTRAGDINNNINNSTTFILDKSDILIALNGESTIVQTNSFRVV